MRFSMTRLTGMLALVGSMMATTASAQWRDTPGEGIAAPRSISVKKVSTTREFETSHSGLAPARTPTPARAMPISTSTSRVLADEAEGRTVGGEPVNRDSLYSGDRDTKSHLATTDIGTPCADSCNTTCCTPSGVQTCRLCPGWTFGIEALFLKPHFTETAGIPVGTNNPNAPVDQIGNSDFEYDVHVRTSLGYVNEDGLGARIRYFNFEAESEELTATNVPAAGLNSFLNGNIRLDVVDIEATQMACFGAWNFNFAGGVRYLDLSLSSVLSFETAGGPGIDVELADNRSDYYGFGPTIAIEALRPIRDTNLSLYANGRLALLFGEDSASTTFLDPLGALVLIDTSRDGVLSTFELQFGAEWKRQLDNGTLFVRAGIEGQVYAGAGNVATEEGDFGLFGGTLGFGYTR